MILFFQSLHTVPYQGANKLTVDKHHSTASTSLSKPHSVCLLLYSSLTREQTLWYFNFHFGQQLHPSPAENHGFRLWGANSHPNHFTLGYKLPQLWIDEANSRCLPLCVSEAKVTPLLSNLMVERWKVTPADEGLAHSQQGHSSSNWGLQCSCICALLCSSVQLPLIVLLSVMTTTLLQRRFSLISQCYCPGEIRRETKMTQ